MIIPSILKGKDVPKHLAIDATLIRPWATKNEIDLKEAVKKNIEKIKELLELQLKKDIPILTIQLSTKNEEEINGLKKFFIELSKNEELHNKKVRVYVFGDWYNSEPELLDSIKKLLESTKDYDQYFLNFCVKYTGQEEILAAVKLLLKKIQSSKTTLEAVTLETFKENLPSSYFIPPDLIIVNNHTYTGILLWDAPGAVIHCTDKYWLDFDKKEMDRALDVFNKKTDIQEE
ncbi:MAG: undecaprenyl diphosphate synthase family protein [Candidatus Nanoarchaeia archaeon]